MYRHISPMARKKIRQNYDQLKAWRPIELGQEDCVDPQGFCLVLFFICPKIRKEKITISNRRYTLED